MSLQDFITKRQQELREEKQSPHAVLEAMRANTGKTADLTGSSNTTSTKMLGGIEAVASSSKEQTELASKSAKDIRVIRETSEKQSVSLGKNLAEMNKTLQALLQETQKVAKYLKPAVNSKDDTYAKAKNAAGAAHEKKGHDDKKDAGPKGPGLGSDLATIAEAAFDLFGDRNKKGGPEEKGGKGKGKGLRLRGRARLASRSLSKGASVVAENASKAWQAVKGSKVVEAVTPKTGSTGSTVGKAWEATKGFGGKALDATKSVGGKAIDAAKPLLSTVGENAGKAWEATKGFGGKALEAGKGLAGRMPSLGTIASKAAVPLTLGMAGYEAYDVLTDDSKTGGEKAQGVANVAGGTAGALAGGTAGATMGATLGTMVLPGIGTAVGGVAGGVLGGIGGYFGGSKLTDALGTGLSGALENSKLGEVVGAGAALAMSPFSEDARNAVKANLVPAIAEAGDKFTSATSSLESSTTALLTGFSNKLNEVGDWFKDAGGSVKNAAASVWAGAKQAVRSTGEAVSSTADAVKKGYKEGGVTGALKQGGKAAAEGWTGIKDKTLGAVSERFESGKSGVMTVSSGKGDHGGVSYGTYQLATKNGSMTNFLNSKEGQAVAQHFDGLTPGSEAFNAKYKELTGTAEGRKTMQDAQHSYMQRTHFEPQAAKLKDELGLDVTKEGRAVQEAVWSTSTQYGANSSTIVNALKGKDLSKMSEAEKVKAIQDYKLANVDKNFKSSSDSVKDGVRNRITKEGEVLASIANDPNAKSAAETNAAKASEAAPKLAAATPTASVKTPSPALTRKEQLQKDFAEARAESAALSNETVASFKAKQTTPDIAVRQEPLQRVPVSTPAEVKPVQVANADALKPDLSALAPQQPQQGGNEQVGGSMPTLDSIPVQLTDAGLVLLNIGHI